MTDNNLSLTHRISGMDEAGRYCKALANSGMIPQHFAGKPEACLVALELAQTMHTSILTIMRSMYLVHGTPGFTGQFCVSLLNSCGRYRRIEYRYVNGRDLSAGLQVIGHRVDGDTPDIGAPITPQMVKAEGWDKNPKWRSMAEQMYRYRAAAFFVRTFCPEVLMGYHTVDELRDINPAAAAKEPDPEPMPEAKPAPVVVDAEPVEQEVMFDKNEVVDAIPTFGSYEH